LEHSIKDRKDLVFTDRIIGNEVFMLLDKHIGKDENPDPFISGAQFAEEMYYWKSQGYHVKVKINSIGGRVIDGWSIIDSIIETEAETINVGLAASMAGFALMLGKKGSRSTNDYATAMIHAPKGGSKQFLEVIRTQFKNLLQTRTKFTEAEISDMMDSGKDYFFDSSQMLEKGIVDKIVTTNKTPRISANASLDEMFAVYNSIQEPKQQPKNEEMEIFNKLFGGKTEMESVSNAVQLKADAEALKKENEVLKQNLVASEAKLQAAEKVVNGVKAKELVSEAVKAGKIADKPEVIAAWEKTANADIENAKSLIDAITPTKTVSVVADFEEKKSGLTYEELANRDPKKLAEIAENDPALFAKLANEYQEKLKNVK
jgi:ATP-dependent protease ClpP protease subunit